ncbi:MAG: phosphoribosyl-ATP diphosphatase [Rhodobacterales bacterium]|nr:phosphoribosyl-ATP diphosphatase [Rhodobacterales bacterium]
MAKKKSGATKSGGSNGNANANTNGSGNDQAIETVLERLYAVIESRKSGDPETSHTARMFSRGRRKMCEKVGEESVEVVVAALTEPRERLVSESADLLYHLMILWSDTGITPQDVGAELAKREGISGIAEKASRKGDGS